MGWLNNRAAVLSAAGDTPYVRAMTAGDDVAGYHDGSVTAWVGAGPWGPVGCVLGSAEGTRDAITLLRKETGRDWWQVTPAHIADAGLQPIGQRPPWTFLSAPHGPVPLLCSHRRVAANAEPSLRLCKQSKGDRNAPVRAADVVRLGVSDMDGVSAVLAAALPDAGGKPGDPRVRDWYGVFDGGTVVACLADKSSGGVGFLSSIAVLPSHQGLGLGTALTLSVGEKLFAEHGRLALAVEDHNSGALKLYQRLGFTEALSRVSLQL